MPDLITNKTPDYRDITIRWPGHPKYKNRRVIEDDLVEVIVQKLEIMLMSMTNEVYGDLEFGGNIPYYLWQTKLSNNNLKVLIVNQIDLYIPELNTIGYTLDLHLFDKNPTMDILVLEFVIKGYNVNFVFE